MLGRLYASSNRDVAAILSGLPGLQRARFALFCYARAHLQELGLAVAATCDDADLIEIGGRLGAVLFNLSREKINRITEHNPRFHGRPITLATITPSQPAACLDDDVEDDKVIMSLEDPEATLQPATEPCEA